MSHRMADGGVTWLKHSVMSDGLCQLHRGRSRKRHANQTKIPNCALAAGSLPLQPAAAALFQVTSAPSSVRVKVAVLAATGRLLGRWKIPLIQLVDIFMAGCVGSS